MRTKRCANAGNTSRFSSVEEISPPNTVTAIGPSISCPGWFKPHASGGKSQCSDCRRHQDGHQPFIGAAHHQLQIPCVPLDLDQMLVMRELQNCITSADAKYGHEANHGAQGNNPDP